MILQKLQELFYFTCKRILLYFTKPTQVSNVKCEPKSLHARAMIFHVSISLQMLLFRTAPESKLRTALFPSVQSHEDNRGTIAFIKTRTGGFCHLSKVWGSPMVLSPNWWKCLLEAYCGHKQGGWCHRRDGWVSVERAWLLWIPSGESGCPQYLQGARSTPYFILRLSLQ